MNGGALFQLCFRSSTLCLHNMLTTAVILANLLYLFTWSSFVVSNGGWWTLMSEQVYCLSQNYVVNAMSMVLLGLLTVRCIERTWKVLCPCWLEGKKSSKATHNMILVFIIWILPQLAYDLISLTGSRRLCENPVFHLLPFGDNGNSTSTHQIGDRSDNMLCEEELTEAMIDVHVWQYLILVLPFAIVICVCIVTIGMSTVVRNRHRLAISHSPWSKLKGLPRNTDAWCKVQRCQGKMIVVDIILTLNLIWHLIGRPLMLARTLLLHYQNPFYPAVFLDVGSHVMLTVSCIFIPGVWLVEAQLQTSSSSTSFSSPHPAVDIN
ncbi:hypothetical protein CHUAL_010568 [Chamberlinius hualienensis]